MTALEKKLAKYGLIPYFNAEAKKIKLAYNKVPMTQVYKALRFAEENTKIVAERYTGERYVIITLK